MRFGVCSDPSQAKLVASSGYDFLECSVAAFLKPQEDVSAFEQVLEAVHTSGVRCEAVNILIPGGVKIVGPEADLPALEGYLETVFERAGRAGVEIAVFGSGRARAIPDGFEKERAMDQLAAFSRKAATIAEANGVTIAVEPLNKTECNVLTSVSECAHLVRQVNHPGLRLLADAYHMMKDNDPYGSVVHHGSLLVHTHLATVPNRLPPGAEPCDLDGFFSALLAAGYDGRVSIEARIENATKELPEAYAALKALAEQE